MRKYFPDYYQPRTKDEVDTLFKTALFSFDTSVILELFVLSEAARESWLSILKAIDSDRLWLTYQVAREYHVNVDFIIKGQYESTVSRIHERYDAAKAADLKSWIDKNEFFLGQDSKEALAAFATVFKDNKAALSKTTNELKKKYLSQCKSTKEQLAQLFEEKVTAPWSISKVVEQATLAEIRRKQAIPPGYMDFGKPTNIDGDYFVWRQLIELATEKKKPVIFVTKDLKEDWFTPAIKSSDARTPRSELRQEMLEEAKQEFMLFSFHDFFEEAKKRFGIETTKAVSEEVKKAESDRSNRPTLPPGQGPIMTAGASGVGWLSPGAWLPSTITYAGSKDGQPRYVMEYDLSEQDVLATLMRAKPSNNPDDAHSDSDDGESDD